MTTTKYFSTALEAADKATQIANSFDPADSEYEQKEAPSDIVTQADKKAQIAIIGHIENEYPSHDFLAEETALNEQTDPDTPTWIIDPIDGTTNYQRQVLQSCTMIALEKDNQLHTAVIQMHNSEDTFHAVKGEGAFLNDDPITVSSVSTLEESLFAYEPTNRSVERNDTFQFDLLKTLLTETLGARKNKCAGYDLTRIATGKYDAYIERCAHIWDMAAGFLILTEAGGKVTDFKGNDEWKHIKKEPRNYVATNKTNHEEVLTLIE